ncbi:hypothetical protein [Corynebacterium halotolerans]|uniref:Uncharacterized protein n=1 Tax=Corynebacterium halotolerans YIM 70093 = DSM 44683 TaxID=1121362 RepID=M1P802_9CORY|nr:hypothetical protein [Corynebacterium halotolerans]AGF72796.1 hypothetical protein A605_08970 [Corynebacterium halotolerans YIM 70093 = DSM 44683]
MREISTDLNLLIRPSEWDDVAEAMPAKLADSGYEAQSVHSQIVDLTCEPDNMLVAQFAQTEGHAPSVEVLHRVVVNGSSDLDLREATKAVTAALPAGAYWYGTSHEGHTEPGVSASCAWQHDG